MLLSSSWQPWCLSAEVAIRLDPARHIELLRYEDETSLEPKPSATSRHIGTQETGQAVLDQPAHSIHESEPEACSQPDADTDLDSDDPHNLRDNPYGVGAIRLDFLDSISYLVVFSQLGLLGPHPTTTGLLYPFDEYTQTWDRGMAEDGETRDECLRRLGLD